MTMTLTTPHLELRAFLTDAIPTHRARWSDESFEARAAWQRTLADGGWAALAWPVEHGGRGLGPGERVACDAELAAVDAPMIAGILGIANVGPTLIAFGDEDQRRSLPKILDTSELWCQGFSEPDAGSDLAGLRTTARIDGDEFVIDGQKTWTSEGMEATHCQLLVRTDPDAPPHKGISVLLVPLDLPGIERRPIVQMTGRSGFAELFFDGARVPRSALLGPLHDGWRVTMTTLGYERAGVIAMASRLERDVTRNIARLAASTTIGPMLRQELAQRYIEARVVGLLGLRALARIEDGGRPGPEQSVIKLAWSTANRRTAETLMGVLGADGMVVGVDESDDVISTAFLRARASTIAAGTTEVMKNILGERVLGLPKG
ncbi:MAG: acyl-CoA dehydrogenase family protein [Ilumatobacteraceae bacterium]